MLEDISRFSFCSALISENDFTNRQLPGAKGENNQEVLLQFCSNQYAVSAGDLPANSVILTHSPLWWV